MKLESPRYSSAAAIERAASAPPSWRPVHPVLRAVAALLVVCLTIGGPAPLSAALTPKTLYVDSTTATATLTPTLSNESYKLTIVPPAGADTTGGAVWTASPESISVTLGTPLSSGSFTLAGLNFTAPYVTDVGTVFDGVPVTLNPATVPNLVLGVNGLTLPYGMSLAYGTADTDGNVTASGTIFLSGAQTWNIGTDAGNSTGSNGILGVGSNLSLLGVGNTKSIKVVNFTASAGSLTLNIDQAAQSEVSKAFLDIGANINVTKQGKGDLYLVNSSTAAATTFNGAVSIVGGTVWLTDSYMKATNGVGPSIAFPLLTGVSSPTLVVQGTNTVSSLSEIFNPDVASGGYSTVLGHTDSISTLDEPKLARLILDGGPNSLLGVQTLFKDFSTSETLTLVKRGSGILELTNAGNTFSGDPSFGGFLLQQGTVKITTSGTNDGTTISGPLGAGGFVIDGGSAGVTLLYDKDPATDIAPTLYNSAFRILSSGTTQAAAAVVSVTALSSGVSLTLAGDLALEDSSSGRDPFAAGYTPVLASLSVSGSLLVNSAHLAGNLTLLGGGSLTLGPAAANTSVSKGSELGSFTLKDGTLVLNHNLGGALSISAGVTGSTRNLIAPTGAFVQRGQAETLPVWSAAFNVNAGGQTLEFKAEDALNQVAAAVNGAVSVNVSSGTLAVGILARDPAAAASSLAVLSKSGTGTLQLNGAFGGALNSGSNALSGMAFLSGPVILSPAGASTFAGTLALGSGSSTPTITVANGASFAVSGALSGVGFTKDGPGALALTSSTNGLTGAILVKAGSLTLGAGSNPIQLGDASTGSAAPAFFLSGSTYSGAIVVGSSAANSYTATIGGTGTSSFSGGVTLTNNGNAAYLLQAGSGAIVDFTGNWTTSNAPVTIGAASTSGTIRFSKAFASTGGVTVSYGTLAAGMANMFGSASTTPVFLSGGNLDLGTNATSIGSLTLTSGSIYGTGNLSAGSVTASAGTINAPLAGSGSLQKIGDGILNLGLSTYTGLTTITQGVLNAKSLPQGAVINNGTYNLTLASTGTYSSTLSGTGVTTLSASAPVTLTLGTGANFGTTLQIGTNVTLSIASGAKIPSSSTITLNGGKLTLGASGVLDGTTVTVNNGGSIDFAGTSQNIPIFTIVSGGTIFSSTVQQGTLTSNRSVEAGFLKNINFIMGRVTNLDAADLGTTWPDNSPILALYSGALGDLAAGGTAQIITRAKNAGATLKLDGKTVATGSIDALLWNNDVANAYSLSIEGTLVTPSFSAISGVGVTLATGGSYANGTFSIADTLTVDGGTLSGGTATSVTAGSYLFNSGSVNALLTGASAKLVKVTAGAVSLNGGTVNTYGGGTQIDAGTLTLLAPSLLPSAGSLSITGGTLALATSANQTVASFTQSGGSLTGAQLTSTGGYIFSGGYVATVLAGAGSLNATSGSTTLNAAATYAGDTTISGNARLALGTAGALPSAGNIYINSGTLALGGNIQSVSSLYLTAGSIEGGTINGTSPTSQFALSGGVVNARLTGGSAAATIDAGIVTLNAAADYQRGTTITQSGRLVLGANGALPTNGDVVLVGTLSLGGKSQTLRSFTLNGVNGAQVEGGSITAQSYALNNGSIGAVLNGAGNATVSGSVTIATANPWFTGVTTVQNGAVLTLTNGGALAGSPVSIGSMGSVVFGSAVTSATFGGLSGFGNLALVNSAGASQPVALTAQISTDSTYSGLLSGGGSFNKTGSAKLTLGTAPTYTGATTISAGTVVVSDFLSGNRSIAVAQGASLKLTLSSSTTYSGVLSGAGTITLESTGPVTLTLGAGASLGGNIQLGANITLDVGGNSRVFGSNAALTISSGGTLAIGTTQQEIYSLSLASGALLTGSAGSKVYYGNTPAFVDDTKNPNVVKAGSEALVNGPVAFEVLTKYTPTTDGYRFTAGLVRLLSGTAVVASKLYVDPEQAATTVRFADSANPTSVSTAIIAGGTGSAGNVVIEAPVYTPQLTIGTLIALKIAQGGSLVSAPAAAATQTNITNSGSLIIDVISDDKVIANLIEGSGKLQKTGDGKATLSGANTYTGNTILTGGELVMKAANSLGNGGSINFQGGTLAFAQGVTTDVSARVGSIASNIKAGINTNANSITFASALKGDGSIAKLGAGSLILTAANTFASRMDVKQGTVQIGTGGTSGAIAAPAEVSASAALRFVRSDAVTYAAALSGAGTVEQAGAGALTLSGDNTGLNGALSLTSGKLVLGSNTAAGAAAIAFNGGELQYGTGISTDISAQIASLTNKTARIDVGANNVTFASELSGTSGNLIKTGAGVLALQHANSYTGTTQVNGGSLKASAGALDGTSGITVAAGVLDAVDYNSTAALTVQNAGKAFVSAAARSQGAVTNDGVIEFTATTDKITLAALQGTGFTKFDNDAAIIAGISSGSIAVAGTLEASVSGGNVRTTTLSATTISGGSVTVSDTAAVSTVSGGALNLNGSTANIATLTAGTVALGDNTSLTANSGVFSGTLKGGGALTKATDGKLTLSGVNAAKYTGATTVSAGSLFVADGATLENSSGLTVADAGYVRFDTASTNITLKGLHGTGTTAFAGNATVQGGISEGKVVVAGTLSADISGPSTVVSAGSLISSVALTGGNVTLANGGSLNALTGATLNVNGGTVGITALNSGNVTLANNANVSVATGTYADNLTGTGSLTKTGAGLLTLNSLPAETVAIAVQSGVLTSATNLLAANRRISTLSGSTLNIALASDTTYGGTLSGTGSTNILNTTVGKSALTLSLGSIGSLDGALSLDDGISLNIANSGNTVFGGNTSLTVSSGGVLTLGATGQEVEIQNLVLQQGATLAGTGGKILYDTVPTYVDGTGTHQLINPANNAVLANNLISGSVVFEENSVGGTIAGTSNYRYIAGRVKMKDGSAINGGSLFLDPRSSTTTVKIKQDVTLSGAVVAGGTSNTGTVTIEAGVKAPLFQINSGITAVLFETGSLTGSFLNNGILQLSNAAGIRSVSNIVSGTGTLEKVDAGTVAISGANTYTGATKIRAGMLQIDNANTLASTSSVVFQGGSLRFGTGVTVDLSKRFATADAAPVALDTNGNNVTLGNALPADSALSKYGNGTLTLGAHQTTTGPVIVGQGTLQIGDGTIGDLAASTTTVSSGATLRFLRNDAATLTYAGQLAGLGKVEQAGAGTLALTADSSTFTGEMKLLNGTVLLGNKNAFGTAGVSFLGGTLAYGVDNANDHDLSSQFAAIGAGQTARINTNGRDITFGSAITGSGALTKYGAGTLNFGAANTYEGLTTVAAGAIQYSAAALPTAGLISSLTGTSVILNNDLNGAASYFSGTVQGAGALVKTGIGGINLAKSPTNTGGTNINAGILYLQPGVKLSGSINIATGATLNSSGGSLDNASVLTLGGDLQVSSGVMFLKQLTFAGGTVSLDPVVALNDQEAFGQVFVEQLPGVSSGTSSASDGKTEVRVFTRGVNGAPTELGGPLRGNLSGIPEGSKLTLTDAGGREVRFVDVNGTALSELNTDSKVNLKLAAPVSVTGNVNILGGTLNLVSGGTLIAKSGTVSLGGGTDRLAATIEGRIESGSLAVKGVGTNVTLATGSSVKSNEVSITSGGSVTMNDPLALKDVRAIQVGVSNSGTLVIGAGPLALADKQVLKGSGTIVGPVNVGNGAVLSPGNSPGTLTLDTVTLSPGGQLVLEYAGPGSQDVVKPTVPGTSSFNLAGGAVVIVDYAHGLQGATPPAYSPFDPSWGAGKVTQSAVTPVVVEIRLGNETGTVGDTGVAYRTAVSALLTGALDAANTLTFTRTSVQALGNFAGNLAGVAAAVNQRQLALATTGTLVSALDEIGTGVTAAAALANVPAQIAAVNPAAIAELSNISTARTLTIHQTLVDHYDSLRANVLDTPDGAYTAWSSTYGASHHQSGNTGLGTQGYSGSTWGDVFGVEQRIGGLLIGITGAAGHTTANFGNSSGRVTTESWHGGVYSVLELSGVYLEAGGLFGSTDNIVRRNISAPGLSSQQSRLSVTGSEWVANLGIAAPLKASESLTLTPSLRGIIQGQNLGGGQESSLNGLEVSTQKQSTTTVQHQAGLEVRKKFAVSGMPAAASLSVDWLHNYNAKGRGMNMALSGDPNASFNYKGSDAGADAFRIGAAFETVLTQRMTMRFSGDYQTQGKFNTARGTISFGYQF